jgi:hypothetical protein
MQEWQKWLAKLTPMARRNPFACSAQTFTHKENCEIGESIHGSGHLTAMTASKPPNLTAAAVSWIVAPLVLSGITFWSAA